MTTIEERALEAFPVNWIANFGKSYDANAKDRERYIEICREQRQIDIEQFLSLTDMAIEEWNAAERHRTFYIDKEGAMRRFRKALEEEQ